MAFDAPTTPSFLAAAREIVAGQVAAATAHPTVGVCWSGMGHDPAPKVETVEAVADRLERRAAEREAFLVTPRGRFILAVNSLGRLGFDEADTVLSIYSRNLADERQPLNVEAAGRALRILADIRHSDAIEAIRAVADMMAPALKAVA